MKTKNKCTTSFRIVGDFCPEQIASLLGVKPDMVWQKGDVRKDGSVREFSSMELFMCEAYDVEVANQMMKTITPLIDKTDLLNQIRNKYVLSYYIEVVPTVYADDINPCLAPSLEVMDFCHATRTEIDIDLYVLK